MIIIFLACLVFAMMFEYKKNTKYIPIIILFIIICFTKDNNDLDYYLIGYEKASQGVLGTISRGSYLLSLIMYCFSRLGLDYYQFRMVITVIELLMINSTLNRYLKYQSLFWTALIFFPGWWMSTIFRHTFALSVLIYGLKYLIEDEKYNSIKYIVCVIVSGLLHSAFWIFLILLVVKYFDNRKVLIISSIVALFMVLARNTSIVERLIILFPIEDDIVLRLNKAAIQIHFKSVFLNIALALSISGVGILSYLIMEEKIKFRSEKKIKRVNTINDEIFRYLYPINSCIILVVAFSLYSSVCNRLYHFFAIYNIIAFALSEQKYCRSKANRLFLDAFIILYLIFISVLFCHFTPTLKTNIIDSILNNNIVLGW